MLFLVLDLDQPKRFIYVMLRPQFKSWLTRGGYLLAAFGGSLALWVAGELLSMQIFSDIAIGLGILIASILAIYTAFLFGQAKGRDFWQSPALPLHMMAQSIMAGAAVLLIGSMILPDQSPEWIALLGKILLVALGANTVITLTEVMMPHPTIDAKLTARMITGKRFGLLFYAGTLLIGNILPFALLLANIPAGVVIAAAVLIGVYITEHIWVKAPQLIPLS
jgi:formate-dependent nitrite reductase membrane component NrfD